jgi:hypothetical protein
VLVFVLEAIDNIQILPEFKDSRDAHFANRSNRKTASISAEIARSAAVGDGMFDEENETTMLDHFETMELSRFKHANEVASHILDSIVSPS